MTQKIKYLDKDLLNKINHISTTIYKFNRTLPQDVVDELDPDALMPITFAMVHEHIAGKAADPHMRCVIVANPAGRILLLDVAMELYDLLPEHEIDEVASGETEVAAR